MQYKPLIIFLLQNTKQENFNEEEFVNKDFEAQWKTI